LKFPWRLKPSVRSRRKTVLADTRWPRARGTIRNFVLGGAV
jgi:hypothetical protein